MPQTPAGINVSSLIEDCKTELLGEANAVNDQDLLLFLNRAKDRVWSVVKQEAEDYFVIPSQSSDSDADQYFPIFSTSTRSYSLPNDCMEPRFIEITGPSGYEQTRLIYRKISHPDFQYARRNATQAGSSVSSSSPYAKLFYTIVGKNRFELAQYPPAALVPVLWYVRSLLDFDVDDQLDEILFPFSKALVTHAVKRVHLSLQEEAQFEEWEKEWREEIVNLAQTASPRSSTDPQFAASFWGEEEGED